MIAKSKLIELKLLQFATKLLNVENKEAVGTELWLIIVLIKIKITLKTIIAGQFIINKYE